MNGGISPFPPQWIDTLCITKTKRTRSNSRESIEKADRYPPAHDGLAAGSSPAWPANLRLQRKLRHRRPSCFACSILPIALMCWIRPGWFTTPAARELLADNDIKERYCSM